MPGSFRYTEGSYCCVEKDVVTDCSVSRILADACLCSRCSDLSSIHQHKECKTPGPGNCWPTSYMPFFTGKSKCYRVDRLALVVVRLMSVAANYLTFTCSDGSGVDKKRAVNGTRSGDLSNS